MRPACLAETLNGSLLSCQITCSVLTIHYTLPPAYRWKERCLSFTSQLLDGKFWIILFLVCQNTMYGWMYRATIFASLSNQHTWLSSVVLEREDRTCVRIFSPLRPWNYVDNSSSYNCIFCRTWCIHERNSKLGVTFLLDFLTFFTNMIDL